MPHIEANIGIAVSCLPDASSKSQVGDVGKLDISIFEAGWKQVRLDDAAKSTVQTPLSNNSVASTREAVVHAR